MFVYTTIGYCVKGIDQNLQNKYFLISFTIIKLTKIVLYSPILIFLLPLSRFSMIIKKYIIYIVKYVDQRALVI